MLTAGETAPAFDKQPVFGLPVQVPPRRYPQIVCFVRGLSSPMAREALTVLQQAWPRFDVEGFGVLAVTSSRLRPAQDYVPRHHLLFPLVVDPDHELFGRFGVGGDKALVGTLRGLAMGGARRAVRALRHGHGALERGQLQLPAEFVIAPDGKLLYARYGEAVTDLPDVEALLAAARSWSPGTAG
jgi:peroxiredoxin